MVCRLISVVPQPGLSGAYDGLRPVGYLHSFMKMFEAWLRTVLRFRNSPFAISWLLLPCAMRERISSSRSVSSEKRAAEGSANRPRQMNFVERLTCEVPKAKLPGAPWVAHKRELSRLPSKAAPTPAPVGISKRIVAVA